MRDVIRMWTKLGNNLPGISLTIPMFSDGLIDHNPSLIGPKISLFKESLQLTRPHDDWYNRCYSSFVYLPTKFRRHDRLAQPVFSTSETCLHHYSSMEKDKADYEGKTEYMRSHCTPQPDRLNMYEGRIVRKGSMY